MEGLNTVCPHLSLLHQSDSYWDALIYLVSNRINFIKNNIYIAFIFAGCMQLSRAHMLYQDLFQAQSSLVLLSCLHLLYLVTPYDLMSQIKPNPTVYFSVVGKTPYGHHHLIYRTL